MSDIETLLKLSHHKEKSIRLAVNKKALFLAKSSQVDLHSVAFKILRSPATEACCCIREIKVLGLLQLALTAEHPTWVTESVLQMLTLTQDPSNKMRYLLTCSLIQLLPVLHGRFPSVYLSILKTLEGLTQDAHPWVRERAAQTLVHHGYVPDLQGGQRMK